MTRPAPSHLDSLWAHHHAQWRDPAQVVSQWREAERTDANLLRYRVRGDWWETLAAAKATLLVTREYEHLVIALCATESGPKISYLPLPHPSGLVVDRRRKIVHIASTRNPNQIYELRPVSRALERQDVKVVAPEERTLVPVRSQFLPGCLYLHDLALIGGELHANSVGQNAIVRISAAGQHQRVWWPQCIAILGPAGFGRNHLQLKSIAAGKSLAESFFSASADSVSKLKPGHPDFPVDKRGVIFSGHTEEAIVRGLTRPHSARLHRGRLWVDNSGYGEVGVADADGFKVVARLPGWTRGLCFCGNVAFVGTSRVIPRFRQYAPGLDAAESECAIHALDVRTGCSLGSLTWPQGNQIFAIDWLPSRDSHGFPFRVGQRQATSRNKNLFYTFETN